MLCMDQGTNVVDLTLERGVGFYLFFYLFTRVNDGRVIASTQLFADGWIRNTEFFAQHIHDYLARLHHLLLTGLFVDAFLRNLVVLRDAAYDLIDRDSPIRLYVVFDECADVCLRHRLP